MNNTTTKIPKVRRVVLAGSRIVCNGESMQKEFHTYQPWVYDRIPFIIEFGDASPVGITLENAYAANTVNTTELDVTVALSLLEVASCTAHMTLCIDEGWVSVPRPVFPMYKRETSNIVIDHIYIETAAGTGVFDVFKLQVDHEGMGPQRILCLGSFGSPIHYKLVRRRIKGRDVLQMDAI